MKNVDRITDRGEVLTWGANDQGQLGNARDPGTDSTDSLPWRDSANSAEQSAKASAEDGAIPQKVFHEASSSVATRSQRRQSQLSNSQFQSPRRHETVTAQSLH